MSGMRAFAVVAAVLVGSALPAPARAGGFEPSWVLFEASDTVRTYATWRDAYAYLRSKGAYIGGMRVPETVPAPESDEAAREALLGGADQGVFIDGSGDGWIVVPRGEGGAWGLAIHDGTASRCFAGAALTVVGGSPVLVRAAMLIQRDCDDSELVDDLLCPCDGREEEQRYYFDRHSGRLLARDARSEGDTWAEVDGKRVWGGSLFARAKKGETPETKREREAAQGEAKRLLQEGRAETRAKRYEAAIAAFDGALARDPEQKRAWSGRGYAYLSRNAGESDRVAAIDDFAYALWLDADGDPQFARAVRYNLGLALIGQGRTGDARVQLMRCRDLGNTACQVELDKLDGPKPGAGEGGTAKP